MPLAINLITFANSQLRQISDTPALSLRKLRMCFVCPFHFAEGATMTMLFFVFWFSCSDGLSFLAFV
jgi:hypothetical protein